MKLPKILHTLSEALSAHNAKAIIVGGAVRDHWIGQSVKDYDIEVYGLDTLEKLRQILSRYGSVNLVGKSFGVLKFTHAGKEYDFSFPRRESKSGSGHRGFAVTIDGEMNFEEAARRRDFSLNAMGYEIESGVFLDPFGGGMIWRINDCDISTAVPSSKILCGSIMRYSSLPGLAIRWHLRQRSFAGR